MFSFLMRIADQGYWPRSKIEQCIRLEFKIDQQPIIGTDSVALPAKWGPVGLLIILNHVSGNSAKVHSIEIVSGFAKATLSEDQLLHVNKSMSVSVVFMQDGVLMIVALIPATGPFSELKLLNQFRFWKRDFSALVQYLRGSRDFAREFGLDRIPTLAKFAINTFQQLDQKVGLFGSGFFADGEVCGECCGTGNKTVALQTCAACEGLGVKTTVSRR